MRSIGTMRSIGMNVSSRLSALTESRNFASSGSEVCTSSMRVERPSFVRSSRQSEYFTSWIWNSKQKAKAFIEHRFTQLAVAFLIAGNFLTNIVESTIDPQQQKYTVEFWYVETSFTIAFFVELAVNMVAHWFWEYWRSAWNVFDFIVVAIGLLILCDIDLGPLQILRMLRAFRVFRLFKKVSSFNKIIQSLAKAIPGVMNAFGILLLIMSIYAVLAVEFFSTAEGSGFETGRGLDHGTEYFGNFPKALYTMFQVLTGESWSEAVVRPLLQDPHHLKILGGAFFFVSFIIVAQVILINVVIAVLLEKMVDESDIEQQEIEHRRTLEALQAEAEGMGQVRSTVYTTSNLSNFSNSYPPLSDICGLKYSTSALSDSQSDGAGLRFQRGESAASLTSFATSLPELPPSGEVHEPSRLGSPRSPHGVGPTGEPRSPTLPPASSSTAEVMRNLQTLQRDVHDLKVGMRYLIQRLDDDRGGLHSNPDRVSVASSGRKIHRLRRSARQNGADGTVMDRSRSVDLDIRPHGSSGESVEEHLQVRASDATAVALRLGSSPPRPDPPSPAPMPVGGLQWTEPRHPQDSINSIADSIFEVSQMKAVHV